MSQLDPFMDQKDLPGPLIPRPPDLPERIAQAFFAVKRTRGALTNSCTRCETDAAELVAV